MTTASWIIVDSRNKPIMETWSERIANAVNTDKGYKAIPVFDWLANLNKRIKQDEQA